MKFLSNSCSSVILLLFWQKREPRKKKIHPRCPVGGQTAGYHRWLPVILVGSTPRGQPQGVPFDSFPVGLGLSHRDWTHQNHRVIPVTVLVIRPAMTQRVFPGNFLLGSNQEESQDTLFDSCGFNVDRMTPGSMLWFIAGGPRDIPQGSNPHKLQGVSCGLILSHR